MTPRQFYALPMQERRQLLIAIDPLWEALETKLLAVGGERIAYNIEPSTKDIVERGIEFSGKSRMMRGEPSRCHGNASHLWLKNKDFKIVEGWALSEDSCWRQHTWGILNDKTIETTVKRTKYFGVVLEDKEAYRFAESNLDIGELKYIASEVLGKRIGRFTTKRRLIKLIRSAND